MEQLFHWIQVNFPLLDHYKYLLIFIGSALEGMNIIILGGFLVSIHTLKAVPVLFLAVIGCALNGYIWYYVGYFGGAKPIDRWGRKDPKSRKVIETVESYFHRYSGRAILLTKLTWSLTIATLIMAGSFKYSFKKFSIYNLVGSAGWVGITFGIGYVFGQGYSSIFTRVKTGYVLLFLAGAIIVVYLFKKLFASRFIKSLYAMQKLREIGDRLRESLDKLISN